ncbi:MAG: hypothetical protein J7J17_02880 [Hadesarchaea archaeon]|nr:hypothetical protein [Hadesarchaea archaeon]
MDELAKLEFKRHELSPSEKLRIVDAVRGRLIGEEGIIFAYLHGSFVELNRFKDVDVGVWVKADEDPFRYAVDLAAKVGGELGLPLDIHVLNDSPLPFKHRVLTEGVLLFSRDEGLRLRLVEETARRYMDLKLFVATNR